MRPQGIVGGRSLEPKVLGGGLASLTHEERSGFRHSTPLQHLGREGVRESLSSLEGPRFDGGLSGGYGGSMRGISGGIREIGISGGIQGLPARPLQPPVAQIVESGISGGIQGVPARPLHAPVGQILEAGIPARDLQRYDSGFGAPLPVARPVGGSVLMQQGGIEYGGSLSMKADSYFGGGVLKQGGSTLMNPDSYVGSHRAPQGGSVSMMPDRYVGGGVQSRPAIQVQQPFVNTTMPVEEFAAPRYAQVAPSPIVAAPSVVSGQPRPARVVHGGILEPELSTIGQRYAAPVIDPLSLPRGPRQELPPTVQQFASRPELPATAQQFAGEILQPPTFQTSVANGASVVSTQVVNRQDMMAQGHIVQQPGAGFENAAPLAAAEAQPKCAILQIPDEYMAHISQNDLLEIQDMCGSSIQYMQPEPESGSLEWEVRVYGPDEARKRSHEILEQRLNDRLAAASAQPAQTGQAYQEPVQESTMTLPGSCMEFFYKEDFQQVKANTGCEVDVFEPDPNLQNDEWKVRVTGTAAGIEAANQLLDSTLQERMAFQQQDDLIKTMPMQQPTETVLENVPVATTVDSIGTVLPTTMGGPPTTVMGIDTNGDGIIDTNVIGVDRNFDGVPDALQGQAEQLDTVSMPTTLLPVPEEYVRMLVQEDLDALEREIGCAIKVNEPEGGSSDYNFVLYGTAEQRKECHMQIEDILTRRQAETIQEGEYAGEYEIPPTEPNAEEVGMVPCTVLPIPKEYLDLLGNRSLDEISDATGCQIQVSQDEQEGELQWQLSLFGADHQRAEAHAAIEHCINEALGCPTEQ